MKLYLLICEKITGPTGCFHEQFCSECELVTCVHVCLFIVILVMVKLFTMYMIV